MSRVYVGLDLWSSALQQVAIETRCSVKVNRSFTTSEANLRAAFADLPSLQNPIVRSAMRLP
jgi:hypothetical protein